MNGFSTEEDSRDGPPAAPFYGQSCCLIDDGDRCVRPAGNASFSKRIQKSISQKKLKLDIDKSVSAPPAVPGPKVASPHGELGSAPPPLPAVLRASGAVGMVCGRNCGALLRKLAASGASALGHRVSRLGAEAAVPDGTEGLLRLTAAAPKAEAEREGSAQRVLFAGSRLCSGGCRAALISVSYWNVLVLLGETSDTAHYLYIRVANSPSY